MCYLTLSLLLKLKRGVRNDLVPIFCMHFHDSRYKINACTRTSRKLETSTFEHNLLCSLARHKTIHSYHFFLMSEHGSFWTPKPLSVVPNIRPELPTLNNSVRVATSSVCTNVRMSVVEKQRGMDPSLPVCLNFEICTLFFLIFCFVTLRGPVNTSTQRSPS